MKNEHAEQYEQLTAYLDGELSGAARAEVEHLLAADEDARILLQELRQMSGLVASLPRGRAPADLAESVTAGLERDALLGDGPTRTAAGTGGGSVWRLLAIAASVTLVVTAGWLVFPQLPLGRPERDTITLADRGPPLAAGEKAGLEDEVEKPTVLAMADAKEGNTLDARAKSLVGGASPIAAKPASALGEETDRAEEAGAGAMGEDAESLTAMAKAEVEAEAKADVEGPVQTYAFADRDDEVRPPEVLIAAPASQPPVRPEDAFHEGEFDRLLAGQALSNQALREAPAAAFSNRVAVIAGPEMQARLLSHISTFMEANRIVDAQTRMLPEPIQSDQSFYLVSDPPQSTMPVRQAVGGQAEVQADVQPEVQVVMNVLPSQAAHLIVSMEEIAQEYESDVVWEANDITISDASAAPEVIRRLKLGAADEATVRHLGRATGLAIDSEDGRSGQSKEAGLKKTRRRSVAAPARSRGESGAELGVAGERADTEAEKDEKPAQKTLKKPASVGRTGRGLRRADGWTGDSPGKGEHLPPFRPDDGLVALAISLRPAGGGGAPISLGWLDAAAGVTSQPASTQSSTTSQPTSQRSAGG